MSRQHVLPSGFAIRSCQQVLPIKLNKSKQSKTKQNKAKQSNTKQSKTKQSKTSSVGL
jgi:hypothetical protein